MGILYKESERSYGFIHQHFRDYFAAVNIVNRMRVADTASEDSFPVAREILQPYEKSAINPLLMEYVGEYLGEHHNNPSEKDVRAASAGTEEAVKDRALISELFNIYRNSDQSSSYAVYNLFTILKRVRKDLSGFDFHNLDLRGCQFYGVPLDTCAGTNFSGALIDAGNWFAEGHSGKVNTASFSPDGRKIVTASDDGTARIWDAETGILSITLYEEDGLYIEGVDFCDIDSKSILTDIQKEIFRQYGAIV